MISRGSRWGRLVFAATVAVAAGFVTAAPAAAQDSRSYTLTVSPDQVEQSTTVEMTATITNTGKSTQKIGSANIVIPGQFSDLELLSGPASTTLAGDTIQMRYLSLRPGRTATAVVRATAPADTGQYFWIPTAKSSDTFSEQDNPWVLLGAATDRDTNVFAPSPPPPPPPDCVSATGCTARHGVPLEWVRGINPLAGEEGDYFVDTTVAIDELVATQEQDGPLVTVRYLDPKSESERATNLATACDDFINYREPSDAAVLFTGPNPKTVTFSLSPDLESAIAGFQNPESCFSAPDPFTAKALDAPFLFQDQVWENGLLDACNPAPVLDSACVDPNADGSWVTIKIPDLGLGPDPANR